MYVFRYILLIAFLLSGIGYTVSHAQDLEKVNIGVLGFSMPEGERSHTIPFELIDNLIVVNVVMNGTLPLKFIVDTGVRTSILTEKTFTDILNIKYSRKISIPVPGGQKVVDAYIAPNITMNLNGLVGKGHALLVLEEDLLELKNILGHNVQGILGYELFSRFIIEIDYQNKIMTLFTPKAFDKRNLNKRRKYHRIPITIEDTKPYCLTTIQLNDSTEVEVKLMLDTGASHAMLLDIDSHKDIYYPERKVFSHLGRGLGGDILGYIGRINALDFAGFRFKEVISTFPIKQFYDQGWDKIYRNGTLGGGIFSRFKIVFDFVNGYVYVKKNKKFRKPFEFNMSGIVIKAKGLYLNNFEIITVRENSTAALADIQKGDAILRINGHLASEMELGEVHSMLNSSPNRVLRLELFRNGENIKRKFRLARII